MAEQAAQSDAHEALGLQELATVWAGAYKDFRRDGGMYRARFRYEDEAGLEADSLAGLDSVIRAHWARWTMLLWRRR